MLIASFSVVSATDTTNNGTLAQTTQQTESTNTNILTNDDNTIQTSQSTQSRNLNKNLNNQGEEKYFATSEEDDPLTDDTILKIDSIGYDNIKYHDTLILTGRLTDKEQNGVQGKIHLNFNNTHATVVSAENGAFYYFYYVSKIGHFNITATYSGNRIYSASNDSVVIDVNKQNSRIVLNNITPVRSGDGAVIGGRLIDANENGFYGTVKLLINQGRATIKTDNQGYFTYNCTIGKVGINNVTAWYLESDKYTASDNTTTTFVINKKKLYTKIVFDDIEPVELGENITISGNLLDEKGNAVVGTVKMLINNGRATVKTDINGVFSYVYNTKRAGLLNISASYLGNNRYDLTNANISVNVEKIRPKIIIISPNNNVLINTVVNVTGQLCDNMGKGISNRKLHLTFKSNSTKNSDVITDNDGFFSDTVLIKKAEQFMVHVMCLQNYNYLFTHYTAYFNITDES